jgi:acyl carrier protein
MAKNDIVIDEPMMRRAVGHVVPDFSEYAGLDTRFDALGLDSLLLAELIVKLEEETASMLDLRATERLATLRDLTMALHPFDGEGE